MSSENHTQPAGLQSRDQLLSLLSAEHTRHVLRYFHGSREQVAPLEGVADYVETRQDAPEHSDPDHVATLLHHSTLPRLTALGIVDYDRRHHTVRYRGHPMVEEHFVHVTGTEE